MSRRKGKGINGGGVGAPSRYKHPVEAKRVEEIAGEPFRRQEEREQRAADRRRAIIERRQRERAEGLIP